MLIKAAGAMLWLPQTEKIVVATRLFYWTGKT